MVLLRSPKHVETIIWYIYVHIYGYPIYKKPVTNRS